MKSTFKKLQSIYDYIVLNVDSYSQTKRPAQVDIDITKAFTGPRQAMKRLKHHLHDLVFHNISTQVS